jgi:hypothetical protein
MVKCCRYDVTHLSGNRNATMNFCRAVSNDPCSAFEWKDSDLASCAMEISATLIFEYLRGVREVSFNLTLFVQAYLMHSSVVQTSRQRASSYKRNSRRVFQDCVQCRHWESHFRRSQGRSSDFEGLYFSKRNRHLPAFDARHSCSCFIRTRSLRVNLKASVNTWASSHCLSARLMGELVLRKNVAQIFR